MLMCLVAPVAAQEARPSRDVAVEAVLQLPRETPVQRLQAVVTLMDLEATDDAQRLLTELAEAQLSDTERAELVRQLGTYRMMQLARHPALAGTAGPFVEACMAAAAAAARDPQRLGELLGRFSDDSPVVRRAARADLQDAGIDGVRFAIRSLATEQNADRRLELQRVLAGMGPLATGPLLGALSTENPQLAADVIGVLAALRESHALPLLVVPALLSPADSPAGPAAQRAYQRLTGRPISPDEAERRLAHEVSRYIKGVLPFTPDADGRIELWFWDDQAQQFSTERYPSHEARVVWAGRLAEQLDRLNPSDEKHRRMALLLGLEAAKLRQGYELSFGELELSDSLSEAVRIQMADAHGVSRLLADALAADCAGAAAAACDLLAQAGDDGVLYSVGGGFSPLAEALHSAHRRVRFAALRAVLALDPQSPYPGSSRVPELLEFFARGGGESTVLVASPVIEKASTVGGLVASAAGYEVDVADTGNDLVRLARDAADAEFIVVDATIDSPGVRDVLYSLAAHPAAAGLPTAVLAPAGREYVAQRLAEENPRVVAFARPHSTEAAQALVEQLIARAGRNYVTREERAEQAMFAMEQIGELLARDHCIYNVRGNADLLGRAAFRAELSEQALASLPLLGTPASQQTLLDYASRPTASIESRRVAAEAFNRSVRRHGVLLTTDEILRQYDRYNASADADAEVQQVLGKVLDTLEAGRDGG